MHSSLYFVCPTDCLEPVINRSFGDTNYFYTSLGNSVVFDEDTVNHIKGLILKHNIKEISFVLSLTNPIIIDALDNQSFTDIIGLNEFYEEILRQKKNSEVLFRKHNRQFTILSYHLNNKIRELQHALDRIGVEQPQISGKIYDQQNEVFNKIYPNLVCTEYFSLN
ncbi:MAG: hypothetical protein AAF361_01980 [Bacteroidota bacterium]